MERAFAWQVLVLACLYWGKVAHKAWRFRRRRGRLPAATPASAGEAVSMALWCAIVAVWLLQPVLVLGRLSAPAWLRPLPVLQWLPAQLMGAALAWTAYLASLWAWSAMGRAWRLGIDASEKTELVTGGPFAVCRHPIYVLQALALMGCWLMLPTVPLLVAMIVQWAAIGTKAAMEERYLAAQHGAAYAAYCLRVRRFLPTFRRKSASGADGRA